MKVRRLCKSACSLVLAGMMAFMSPLATLAAQIDESDEEIIVVDDLFVEDTGYEVTVDDESVDEAISDVFSEGSEDTDTEVVVEEYSDLPVHYADANGNEADPEQVQKYLEMIGEGIASLESPLEFAGFATGEIIPAVIGLDSKKSETQEIMEQLDTVLKNQDEMMSQLKDIKNELAKQELISDIRDFYKLDFADELATNYGALRDMDLGRNDYAGKSDDYIDRARKQLLYFSYVGDHNSTLEDIPGDIIDDTLDKSCFEMGNYLKLGETGYGMIDVTYGNGKDTLFGVYARNCQYKYHWEHQSYDDWISFRNAAFNRYLLAATLLSMSLQARIKVRSKHDLPSPDMIKRLEDLRNQVKDVCNAYTKSAVVKHSDSVRHYWYGADSKTDILLYTRANEQKVPKDTEGYGTGDWFHGRWLYYGPGPLKGVTYAKGYDQAKEKPVWYADKVNPDFWMPYTHYSSAGGYCKCPSADWFKAVKEDYTSNTSLYDILFSKSQGGLSAPSGSGSSWRFMINPDSSRKLVYDQYTWHPDRINMPLMKSDGTLDKSGSNGDGVDFYMYHYDSNEIDTDYIKNGYRVIGIGIADKDPNPRADLTEEQVEKLNERCKDIWNNAKNEGNVYADQIIHKSDEEEQKEWFKGSAADLEYSYVTKDGELIPGYPVEVSVNGEVLDNTDYDEYSKDNAIIVGLHADYLEELPVGNKTLSCRFSNGTSGYEEEQPPVVITSFDVKQKDLTVYAKKDGKYINCDPSTVIAGEGLSLVARNAAGEEVSVTWSSSDDRIAKVDQAGKVTSLAGGTVTITATASETGMTANMTLTVLSVAKSVKIQADKTQVAVGSSITLTVSDEPKETTAGFTWSVDGDNACINVSQDSRTAMITGEREGTVKVRVSANGNDEATDEISIEVTSSTSKDFTINGKAGAKDVALGKTLSMVVNWTNGKPKDSKVTWSVRSVDGAATISKSGVLKGTSEGKVVVEAVSNADPRKTASTEIQVYVPVQKIALNTTKGTLSKANYANALDLNVIITGVSGKNPTGVNVGEEPKVTYTVDSKYAGDIELAQTGNSAKIKAKESAALAKNIPVTATVEAYNGYKKSLTCKVSIVASNPLKSMKLSKTSMTIRVGEKAKLDAILNPLNPDGNTGVKWSSDDPDVVSVDDNGNITASSAGDAVIIAKTVQNVKKGTKSEPLKVRCKIKVKPRISLTIATPNDTKLEIGKKLTIKTKWPEGKPSNSKIKWSVAPISGKATVDQKGVLTGVSEGTVIVKAVSEADPSLSAAVYINITAGKSK